jgi:hypothetical protein
MLPFKNQRQRISNHIVNSSGVFDPEFKGVLIAETTYQGDLLL